jgi:hypothetical protein
MKPVIICVATDPETNQVRFEWQEEIVIMKPVIICVATDPETNQVRFEWHEEIVIMIDWSVFNANFSSI